MKLKYIESLSVNPYQNLATEEYLTFHTAERECILFLWQNKKTVVIGRNQNPWQECNIQAIEQDQALIARRMSGGGAVYHDLGNLNFTFCVRKQDYSVERQSRVIMEALAGLGMAVVASGRNDLLIEGRKFSGHAYYQQDDYCYHHGTLLVDVKMSDLGKYLTVSKAKLESKGVSSVVSRVANLTEFVPELTIGQLKQALRAAFEREYQAEAKKTDLRQIPEPQLKPLMDKYSDYDWIYGRKIPFSNRAEARFDWGGIECQWQVNQGRIQSLKCYSDCLQLAVFSSIEQQLTGQHYNKQAILEAAAKWQWEDPMQAGISSDVIQLMVSCI